MGRNKQYERAELLERAVRLFRSRGYSASSTADLVSELGVNRKSMYAEFGSKQELFEAALEHYNGHELGLLFAPIEAEDAGLDGIKDIFRNFAQASEGAYRGLGCLLCNTASERGALEPQIGVRIDAYFARIKSAFGRVLENARQTGQIQARADLEQLTAFLTTSLIGVATSVRAEAPPEQLWNTYHVIVSMMDDLGPRS